jgi:hypothetical protein
MLLAVQAFIRHLAVGYRARGIVKVVGEQRGGEMNL